MKIERNVLELRMEHANSQFGLQPQYIMEVIMQQAELEEVTLQQEEMK